MEYGIVCHVCGGKARDAAVRCEDCRDRFHADCEPYHRQFDCRTRAEERWIGAVEF